jgi:hypothetical protein
VPPAAGVKAGRRPPGGFGLDVGEDGAMLRDNRLHGSGFGVDEGHASTTFSGENRVPDRV